ncbi:MAG TPA: hypothetical protein VHP11_07615 [Tepidisphaeraceae bacterium]|nr:hypothetical protein [Tepidisphaeraceae bacterium]
MLNFEQTIKNETLQARYLILELAAILDRLDEAAARDSRSAGDDARVKQMAEAIAVLATPSEKPDRAERILRQYSDPER